MRWPRDGWIQDLRQAVRAFRRSPGFTLVAVGTLGLALGVNVGIFSVVDAVLLRPLPFPEPDRLVYIGGTAPGSDLPEEFDLSLEFLFQYQEQSKLLEGVAPYEDFTNTLRVGDRAERVRMALPPVPNFQGFRLIQVAGNVIAKVQYIGMPDLRGAAFPLPWESGVAPEQPTGPVTPPPVGPGEVRETVAPDGRVIRDHRR